MTKDWTGNKTSVFSTLGASNHSEVERPETDYYATDPRAIDYLLEVESFAPTIWECACGEGHLSKKLMEYGYEVYSTDLIYRGFGVGGMDFLKYAGDWNGDIITNPPYKYGLEFAEKSLEIMRGGGKLAMFLKLTFLEGKKRRVFFDEFPPVRVHVFSNRIGCAKNGEFEKCSTRAVCYAWFVWEKGWKGETVVDWIG